MITRHVRRISVIAAALVMVMFGVGLGAAPASAATPGHIKGKVTAPAGVDLSLIYVTAYTTSGYLGEGDWLSASGAYDIKIRSGSYQLQFVYDAASGHAPPVVNPYYRSNAATLESSPRVVVHSGTTTRLSTSAIPPASTISGTVTLASPGANRHPKVTLYDASGRDLGSGGVAADGSFAFGGRRAGDYTVTASADDHFATTSDAFSVVTGGTTVLDLQLEAFPSVSGTVSFPEGTDYPSARVLLIDDDGTVTRSVIVKGWISPDYTLRAPPGDYHVLFMGEDYTDEQWARQWWGGGAFASGSPVITLDHGDAVTGVDATVAMGASIRGSVPWPSNLGIPAEQVQVTAYQHDGVDDTWKQVFRSTTPQSPNFRIRGLQPGEYVLKVSDGRSDPIYQTEFWNDATTAAAAQSITLTAGEERSGITVSLSLKPYVDFAHDYDRDGHPDLLLRTSSGTVVVAYGDGTGGIRETRTLSSVIPSTWRAFVGGDFSGGGNVDVMAIDPAGKLWRYPDIVRGGDPVEVKTYSRETNWKIYRSLSGVGDFTGDGKADLIARDVSRSGSIAVCYGSGSGWVHDGVYRAAQCDAIGYPQGYSWSTADAAFGAGDFDGDGHDDVIVRTTSGALWLYRGNGHQNFLGRIRIPGTFTNFTTLLSVGDFDGDGHSDMIARDTKHRLWLYPGDGLGHLLARTAIAGSWGAYKPIP